MNKFLFATTASAALLAGGIASAQGISLFGDARLGLGYNINNDGSVQGDNDIRAVSRVRFGVNMTGETDSGITFGASIRADNAAGGQGGAAGQRDGSVFVSGNFGTLTFGDTAGADENWVGDVPGNFSLTGLRDQNETAFLTNGGSFNNDDFVANPNARPTLRYDFDLMGFGLSLSSNRDLTDFAVGGGYAGEFAGATVTVGLGYAYIADFVLDAQYSLNQNTGVIDVTPAVNVGEINSYSAAIGGGWENFDLGVTYIMNDGENNHFDIVNVGGSFGFDAFSVGAYWSGLVSSSDDIDDLINEKNGYGLTAQYDLGGGATVNAGVAQVRGVSDEDNIIGDFGIKMAF